jgi:AmiR/NasT family two-component response regulator
VSTPFAAWRDHAGVSNGAFEHGARVTEAVGMVRAQAACTTEEAFVLMHERAQISGQTMENIVDAVLDHSIHFG